MKILFLVLLLVTIVYCGGQSTDVDGSGTVSGDTDLKAFARASQYYFRGSLSRANDEFNAVIYRYPDSPLNEDARLALRRIEYDMCSTTGRADTSTVFQSEIHVIALIGRPAVRTRLERLVSAFRSRGYAAEAIEDNGAPDITLILSPSSLMNEAEILSDSLESWLSRPERIPIQPSGTIHQTIIPGHDGLLVVVGSDAVIRPTAPGQDEEVFPDSVNEE